MLGRWTRSLVAVGRQGRHRSWRQVSSSTVAAAAAPPPAAAIGAGNNKKKENALVRRDKEPMDHRVIGKQQKLFMFHELSPGSAFFLPHGTRVCNRLIDEVRRMYRQHDFQEVATPLIYNKRLWETSGHWDNYRDDMFLLQPSSHAAAAKVATIVCQHEHENEHEKQHQHQREHNQKHENEADDDSDSIYGLKPMNCPGHCLIFNSEIRSFRKLPLRIADFSPLHRNEFRGALSGLTRLRRFTQDDAHIFCKPSQIASEVQGALDFITKMYRKLGFQNYTFALSTRPEKYLGALEDWDQAEAMLRKALEQHSINSKSVHNDDGDNENDDARTTGKGTQILIKHGDGAFYGPKIDTTVTDAFGRPHQLATIQLDFQLPKRFDLQYQDEDGAMKMPVMIHRAALGSVERMLAILLEHHAGRLPFWLSPRQVMVIAIHETIADYAQKVADQLLQEKWYVDVGIGFDNSERGLTFKKLVHDAIEAPYNYIVVVGERERANGTVDLRTRDKRIGTLSLDQLKAMLKEEEEGNAV